MFAGSGLADVNMTGLGVVTDGNGLYTAVVNYDWTSFVTPAKEGYIFDPNSRLYTNLPATRQIRTMRPF
jgi:hypothetical protein